MSHTPAQLPLLASRFAVAQPRPPSCKVRIRLFLSETGVAPPLIVMEGVSCAAGRSTDAPHSELSSH